MYTDLSRTELTAKGNISSFKSFPFRAGRRFMLLKCLIAALINSLFKLRNAHFFDWQLHQLNSTETAIASWFIYRTVIIVGELFPVSDNAFILKRLLNSTSSVGTLVTRHRENMIQDA